MHSSAESMQFSKGKDSGSGKTICKNCISSAHNRSPGHKFCGTGDCVGRVKNCNAVEYIYHAAFYIIFQRLFLT